MLLSTPHLDIIFQACEREIAAPEEVVNMASDVTLVDVIFFKLNHLLKA